MQSNRSSSGGYTYPTSGDMGGPGSTQDQQSTSATSGPCPHALSSDQTVVTCPGSQRPGPWSQQPLTDHLGTCCISNPNTIASYARRHSLPPKSGPCIDYVGLPPPMRPTDTTVSQRAMTVPVDPAYPEGGPDKSHGFPPRSGQVARRPPPDFWSSTEAAKRFTEQKSGQSEGYPEGRQMIDVEEIQSGSSGGTSVVSPEGEACIRQIDKTMRRRNPNVYSYPMAPPPPPSTRGT